MSRQRQTSQAPSALEAYRCILRYIHSIHATEGTKLPAQREMIQLLGICAATLDTAMKWLSDDGVLVRKRRTGTHITTPYPQAPKRSIWQTGIVMPPITRSYFGAVLAHYLHQHFDALGITGRTYMLTAGTPHCDEVTERHTEDFSGLKEDIDDERLDAIATSTRLVSKRLPVCGICNGEEAEFGIQIDYPHLVQESTSYLAQSGCKNIIYVLPKDPSEWKRIALKAAHRNLSTQGITFNTHICSTSGNTGLLFEQRFVEHLLALPPQERPDGLIIQDDISAHTVATILSSTNYRPKFVYQANLQIPLSYPIPVVPFYVDLEQISRESAELLLEKLLNPNSAGKVIYTKLKQGNEMHPRSAIPAQVHSPLPAYNFTS